MSDQRALDAASNFLNARVGYGNYQAARQELIDAAKALKAPVDPFYVPGKLAVDVDRYRKQIRKSKDTRDGRMSDLVTVLGQELPPECKMHTDAYSVILNFRENYTVIRVTESAYKFKKIYVQSHNGIMRLVARWLADVYEGVDDSRDWG